MNVNILVLFFLISDKIGLSRFFKINLFIKKSTVGAMDTDFSYPSSQLKATVDQ